jgi:ornithine--oxo-acid transaminase
LNAIVIAPKGGKTAWDLCLRLRDRGMLAKPTHQHTIRLAPPLVLNEAQVKECADIIRRSLQDLDA